MTKVDDGVEMGIRCGNTNERGEEGQTDLGSTTTSEWRKKEHALQLAEGKGTSVHSKELQRVTDDDGQMKPSRGKRGTKDRATRCQDRRQETSAIGMSGEPCLRKRRRCMEDKGLRTRNQSRSSGFWLGRPNWRSRRSSHHTRWEPASTKKPSVHEEYNSVGDRG